MKRRIAYKIAARSLRGECAYSSQQLCDSWRVIRRDLRDPKRHDKALKFIGMGFDLMTRMLEQLPKLFEQLSETICNAVVPAMELFTEQLQQISVHLIEFDGSEP